MEPCPDEQDMRADIGATHVQNGGDIAPCPDDEHHPMLVTTDEQLGEGQSESLFAISDLNDGGAMEPSYAAPINDTEFEGCDVTNGDGDLTEVPIPATVAEP
ncbi:Hypothetical predicted protein [Olea europaea subsp. europaea]|uniref:Uncharacterized protein n=1 Tax=Olea europaea subsp. europaea TaxID=158383 RepID=A0A8S0PBE5_OLEEU|nr:Hypothetical predicted protein [Olea europaea subsp. europaea]